MEKNLLETRSDLRDGFILKLKADNPNLKFPGSVRPERFLTFLNQKNDLKTGIMGEQGNCDFWEAP